MKKKKKAPVLYAKYREEQEKIEKEERIAENVGADSQHKIVVAEVKAGAKFLEIVSSAVKILLKVLLAGAVFLLCSIGLTVLCNAYLRETFFRAIMSAF